MSTTFGALEEDVRAKLLVEREGMIAMLRVTIFQRDVMETTIGLVASMFQERGERRYYNNTMVEFESLNMSLHDVGQT